MMSSAAMPRPGILRTLRRKRRKERVVSTLKLAIVPVFPFLAVWTTAFVAGFPHPAAPRPYTTNMLWGSVNRIHVQFDYDHRWGPGRLREPFLTRLMKEQGRWLKEQLGFEPYIGSNDSTPFYIPPTNSGGRAG
jgi:hypothetical protein